MDNTIRQSRLLTLVLPAVLCTMLWGTAFPGIKAGYAWFHVENHAIGAKLLFAGLRFLIAGLLVLAIGTIRRKPGQTMRLKKSDLPSLSLLGFFQTFLQYLLLYLGISGVSGTKSALYTSAASFATVLASPLLFRQDRLTIRKIAGCTVGVVGIVLRSVHDGGADGFTLAGDGLVILSNLSGAAGNLVSKKIATPQRTASYIAGWQLTLGGTGLMGAGLLAGGSLSFEALNGWLILLYLAAMAGIAFMIWTELLRRHPVSKVAVYNLLIPVFGTIWSGIFLGEQVVTLSNATALILVCSGIFLVNFVPTHSNHEKEGMADETNQKR